MEQNYNPKPETTNQEVKQPKTLSGFGTLKVVGGAVGAIVCFVIGQPLLGVLCIGIVALRYFTYRK